MTPEQLGLSPDAMTDLEEMIGTLRSVKGEEYAIAISGLCNIRSLCNMISVLDKSPERIVVMVALPMAIQASSAMIDIAKIDPHAALRDVDVLFEKVTSHLKGKPHG